MDETVFIYKNGKKQNKTTTKQKHIKWNKNKKILLEIYEYNFKN